MSVDLDVIGRTFAPTEKSWSEKDTLLYAVGVGAGQSDPTRELEFTTENSEGVPHRVLPMFATLLGAFVPREQLGDFRGEQVLHAGLNLQLHKEIPAAGAARATPRVAAIWDKGSGALIETETEIVDATAEAPLATIRSATFIRGEGGFGGDRGPASAWVLPERPADAEVTYHPQSDQALLYRLCSGDRNPMHSDPAFARRAGFPRPILHGMCTYGYTARALLHTACDGDPARFGSISARFAKPVFPGEPLTISVWREGGRVCFVTRTEGSGVVVDQGTFVGGAL